MRASFTSLYGGSCRGERGRSLRSAVPPAMEARVSPACRIPPFPSGGVVRPAAVDQASIVGAVIKSSVPTRRRQRRRCRPASGAAPQSSHIDLSRRPDSPALTAAGPDSWRHCLGVCSAVCCPARPAVIHSGPAGQSTPTCAAGSGARSHRAAKSVEITSRGFSQLRLMEIHVD